LTDRETTMEDTHVWVMKADGTDRRDVGAAIDNRQGVPQWTPDGAALLFTVQERGHVRLYRASTACGAANAQRSATSNQQPATGGGAQPCKPEVVVSERGTVGAFSMGKSALAYAFSGPSDVAQLYVRDGAGAARRVTDLNAPVLGGKTLAEVESFTFV